MFQARMVKHDREQKRGEAMDQSNSANNQNAQRGVMNRVKESAAAQLSNQKERATEGLGSIATAVRQSSQPLRNNKQDMIAEYVEKAADQLEQFSTRLRERDVNDLMDDAQQFARRRPALFVGAAFVAGVAAARFLKSSSEHRQSEAMQRYSSDDSYRYGGTPTGTPGYTGRTGYSGGGI
jgi:hypothetical protein